MVAVLSLLIVCSFASVGLWTLWAASLPWHWLPRTLLVLAPVSLLLLVPAYEPFMAFVTQATVIAAVVTLGRWWRARRREPDGTPQPRRIHFSLGSLLGIMLLIAAAAAIGVRLPRLNWQAWVNTILIGVSCGIFVLIGAWSVRPGFNWRRCLMAGLLMGVLTQPLLWTDYLVPSFDDGSAGWPPQTEMLIPGLFAFSLGWRWAWVFILPGVAGLVGLTLLWLARCGWLATTFALAARKLPTVSPVRRTLLRVEVVILCVLMPTLPGYFLFHMLFPDPIPVQTPPFPNGYDDLLAAAKVVNDPVFDDYSVALPEELQKALAQVDWQALVRLRLGLDRESKVPLGCKDVNADLTMYDITAFRSLARFLMAQAQVHRYDEEWDLAADAYLDVVRLGQRVGDGGLMIHSLVGSAIAGFPEIDLVEIRRKLQPETSVRAARTLLDIDSAVEPIEEIVEREKVWAQHTQGWHGRVAVALRELCGEPWPNDASFARGMKERQAVRRLLALELALQAYMAEQGSPPPSLQDLVPRFLPRIPEDPFTGSAFSYEQIDGEYRLTLRGSGRDPQPSSERAPLFWLDTHMMPPFSLDDWYAKQTQN